SSRRCRGGGRVMVVDATRSRRRRSVAVPVAVLVLAVAPLSLLAATGAQARVARHTQAACAHHGTASASATHELIDMGWTTEEVEALLTIMERFSRVVCPQPLFLDVVRGPIDQRHVQHDTVWQYIFKVRSEAGRTYRVTAQLPRLDWVRATFR